MPKCAEFLNELKQLWSTAGVQGKQRQHERHPVVKALQAMGGIRDICAQVARDNEMEAKRRGEQDSGVSYEELVDMRLYGYVTKQTLKKLEEKKVTSQQRGCGTPDH
jgi:hypothetical protein